MKFTRKELVHRAAIAIRQYIDLCISENNMYYLTRANMLINDMWEMGIITLRAKRAFDMIVSNVREEKERQNREVRVIA